ncbi:MAG: alpha-hydroxy-acid oxidizing protein [Alphaproteobacteria bacterium]|nr:alpha-hydroxy-acid oxidizing protein [Alphaproteobacteria bacterium]
MAEHLNLAELQEEARRRLPKMVYDYYVGGALDEITLAANRGAWTQVALRHRVLRGVGRRSLGTTVLGQPVSMPILIAPTAFQAMADPEGERATARAAAAAGTVMTLSSLSNHPVEEVCAQGARTWFQLYVYKDREATRALVARAEAAGCSALVFTVDAPVLGTREKDRRNRFTLPPGLRMGNLTADAHVALPGEAGDSGLAAYVHDQIDPDITWSTVEWLRSITSLPVVLKGVVHPEDARLAVQHGASALVVSNHGGRQLDGGAGTLELLPDVVDAVEGAIEVLVDGGVRRGSEVVKALALGARAVLVGRPVLWGLAADGQRGVSRVLELLRAELDETLALCGARAPQELSRDLILRR